MDSAVTYVHEGHDLEIDYIKQQEYQKAVEVEARYNDRLKAERIARQERELQSEARVINLLLGIVFLTVVAAAVVIYYAVRLGRANRENLEKSEQLRSLDVAKNRFFANVSHELRTPLTLIQGPIDTLMTEGQLSDRQRRLLKLAGSSSRQLKDLVDQILELRKLEAGKAQVYAVLTPLAEFFDNCCALFMTLADQKQIDLACDFSLADDFTALIDREKCRVILYNLLANAFKFTPAGGSVCLRVSATDTTLTIVVEDDGVGISAEDIPHVFNRFYQTNRTNRTAEGGTGIGLSLCKEYVELFGGRIDVDSTEGEGVTFTVELPIERVVPDLPAELAMPTSPPEVDGSPPAVTAPRQKGPDGEAAKPSVLVVEDNADVRKYLEYILSGHYRVRTADHGKHALEQLEKMPDCRLILSDIMMPVMDGYQLLEELKSRDSTRHLPVVMLTARSEPRDELRALRIGVDGYLTKPFKEQELLVTIKKLLRQQSTRTEVRAKESTASAENGVVISEEDQVWLQEFEAYIEEMLSETSLSIPQVAETFNLSESTLLRQVKRLAGLSPQQYIRDVRLSRARKILESGEFSSVGEVAGAVGYRDPRSFSRAYQKCYGKLPSEYK
nr:ATP-binding protein [Lewinella sp. JB7]